MNKTRKKTVLAFLTPPGHAASFFLGFFAFGVTAARFCFLGSKGFGTVSAAARSYIQTPLGKAAGCFGLDLQRELHLCSLSPLQPPSRLHSELRRTTSPDGPYRFQPIRRNGEACSKVEVLVCRVAEVPIPAVSDPRLVSGSARVGWKAAASLLPRGPALRLREGSEPSPSTSLSTTALNAGSSG